MCMSQVAKAPTDALHTLEQTSTQVVSAIMYEQASSGAHGGPTMLSLAGTVQQRVVLPPRNVTLSELQRLKRQFVTVHKKAITLGTTEKGVVDWSEARVAEKFATYLEDNLRQ
jgi:protein KTI12